MLGNLQMAVITARNNTGPVPRPLYTPEQRLRRNESRWTVVQGILAPLQFAVFLVSLLLVFRTLATGEGYAAATISIVIKTLILYAIMITGSIWEKVVFGKYLFAESFFWEDVVSMLVLALHSAYLIALFGGWLTDTQLLILALVAYVAYVINAAQFLLKLRAARMQSGDEVSSEPPTTPSRIQESDSHNSLENLPEGVCS